MFRVIQNLETGLVTTVDLTAEEIAAAEAATAAQVFVPPKISDRQFFQQIAVEGKITEAEALAAVATGTIPQAMNGLIEQLPEDQQFPSKMLVAGATEFLRDHPVTQLIGQLYGYRAADIDRIWREASLL